MITVLQRQRLLSTSMVAAVALLLGADSHAESPEEALATFELHPAFQIELVAAEPMVFDPVDLEFDEHGDAYVVEMPGYPFPEEEGRVIRLRDSDGDGVYDERSVLAEGFPVADSLLPYDGGVLVASPPDLVFLKDTDGDGRADVREVVLTGFSRGNTQHNYNGLSYGLDNWIYAGNGGNSGNVKWEGEDDRISIRGQDFRFHIPSKRFELIGRTSGGFEVTFDDWGRYFQTHNTQHIYQLVFPGKFIEALPPSRAGTLSMISDHEDGGLARIFSIGVQESRVNHPEQAGYFSGACGITFYGGGAFPEEFNGNLFVCDVVLNLVHRDVLSPNGGALEASRGRERVEFLASTDRSFRPVNLTTGPDGALYLLDMHRDVIEHPEWIPDELEVNMDIDAGKDKGRIYRITPKTGLPRIDVAFDRDDLEGAVASLGHRNKWWRDTAQRLLVEWGDKDAVPLLKRAMAEFPTQYGRLHAMWTLDGLEALDDADLKRHGLDDENPGVRENALQIAAERIGQRDSLRQSVASLASDPDPRVRLYAALALQFAEKTDEVYDALGAILNAGMDDQWTRMAVAAAAVDDAPALLKRIMAEGGSSDSESAPAFVELLGRTVAQHPDSGAWAEVLKTVATAGSEALLAAAWDGVATGIETSDVRVSPLDAATRELVAGCLERGSLELTRHALRLARATGFDLAESQAGLLRHAREVVEDRNATGAHRVEQLGIVAFAPYRDRSDLLFDLLDTREPLSVQRAAIAQIVDAGSHADAERLVSIWPALGPDVRQRAGDFLLYRRPNNGLLLDALEDGRLKLGEMNFHLERRRHLLWADDKSIAARAEKLFTDAGVVTRAQAIEKMRPALELTGDITRGKAIYQERCAECHQIGTEGFDVGPNLTDIFRKSPEQLMHDILDPNSAAEPDYLAYTAVPSADNFDADVVSGLLVAETDDAITLRQAGGIEATFARSSIESFTTTGLSLMPEELEADLTHQQFADLLAFLLNPR